MRTSLDDLFDRSVQAFERARVLGATLGTESPDRWLVRLLGERRDLLEQLVEEAERRVGIGGQRQ